MFGFHALARSGLMVAVLLGLCAGAVTPSVVHADTNLRLGGTARIAYANGDGVRLRAYPGQEAPEIRTIPEGTVVDVIDGPASAADGSLWYQVSVDDEYGYISEAFLADEASESGDQTIPEESTSDESVAADEGAVSPPIPDGIPATIVGTSGEGARCRVAANADADVIALVPEGAAVSVTGDAVDNWRPVICEEKAGFISADFVAIIDPNNPVTEEATEIATEEVTEESTEAVTEEATEEITEEATEEITEEATEVVTEVVTEEPTEEATDEATGEPTEEATDEATDEPTGEATESPTGEATESPTGEATESPTGEATESPTGTSTEEATGEATETPAEEATGEATGTSTEEATSAPAASETPTEEAALGTPVLSGTGIVLATNGGGVNCRAEASASSAVVAVLAEGSIVQVRGNASDGWLPIVCDGADGYAASEFILLDRRGAAPQSTSASTSSGAISGKAVISGTNGDGLKCRAEASNSGSVITVLREGNAVSLRSGSTGSWQAVTCSGRAGFAAKQYLTYGNITTAGVVEMASTSSTGSAVVSGTNGDGLRCRASASFSAAVLMVISEGKTVTLKGKASSGFQPILCGSKKGYVAVDYLSYVTKTGSTSGQSSTTTSKAAKVSGTGGTGVRLRSRASTSSSIIAVVPEGATVGLRSGSTGDWTAVSYKGSNGFIYSSYLKASSGSTSSADTTGDATSSGLKSGNRAKTSANVNLRYGAKTSAGIAAVVPSGTVVLITGSVSGGFYPVDWDGLEGYIHGDYLNKSNAALSDRNGSTSGGSTSGGSTTGGSTSGGGGGVSTGSSSIVDFAMQYLGYPYVWATHGPSSFDCSGFTYWVVKNVLGRDIGAGLFTQASAGQTIAQGNLQPGDLVFFQNTYTWGLSHVGIYIGGGKFIHAQNESTGVVISELGSSYYASRWYGAVRLT